MNHQGHEGHQGPGDGANAAASAVVDAGLKVHRALGPGLLESAYEHCLVHELVQRKHHVARQVALPVMYDGIRIEAGYRLDLVVDECVIVEIKAVEALLPIHTAQLLTYLKLTKLRVGLLMNFNVVLFKDGVKRLAL